jgi:hypothetical protein
MLGATAAALALSPAAFGQSCATCDAPNTHCPPKFVHWMEGPPKLKFKHACPKPVCDPCNLPHAGYFEPCWAPWPWPPDFSHCALPSAACVGGSAPANVVVPPPPPGAPTTLPPKMESAPAATPMSQGLRLPAPSKTVQRNIEASPGNR